MLKKKKLTATALSTKTPFVLWLGTQSDPYLTFRVCLQIPLFYLVNFISAFLTSFHCHPTDFLRDSSFLFTSAFLFAGNIIGSR